MKNENDKKMPPINLININLVPAIAIWYAIEQASKKNEVKK